MGLYQGCVFWSGSVSLVDGRIEETHTLQEAQAADYHHTFYFSPEQALKIDDGECGFFWITEDGEVEAEWRETLGRDIIGSIKEQIAVIDVMEDVENEENEQNEQERERVDMTGFEKFQQKVKDGILAYLPKEYRGATVDIVHVPRNNGQEQVAMAIKKESQAVPTKICLDEYYTRFPDWISDGTILRTIAGDYLAEESEMKWKAEMAEAVKDFDSVKGNIRVQVVNKDMNRENLRGCPHKEVEGTDLAAVFRVMLYKDGEEHATVLVTDKTMKGWDMDVDALYETALENTAAQAPARIRSLMSAYSGGEESLAPEEVFSEEQELYVLTNPQKWNGAAAMLYPGLLQSIAEATGASFYIMPCSVHEVMLAKEGDGRDAWELQSMVIGSNRYELPPQEILSDQVYFYDGQEQTLSLATSPEETQGLTGGTGMTPAGYEGMVTGGMEEEMER